MSMSTCIPFFCAVSLRPGVNRNQTSPFVGFLSALSARFPARRSTPSASAHSFVARRRLSSVRKCPPSPSTSTVASTSTPPRPSRCFSPRSLKLLTLLNPEQKKKKKKYKKKKRRKKDFDLRQNLCNALRCAFGVGVCAARGKADARLSVGADGSIRAVAPGGVVPAGAAQSREHPPDPHHHALRRTAPLALRAPGLPAPS